MKQKLLIVLVLILLLLLLAGLNAATYVQKEKVADTEISPNRSTYNPGSTGTQALYALLSETGRNVMRWQTSFETLWSDSKNRPSVLIMIGPLRRELSVQEKTNLMQWVSSGGTLILIDREPPADLVATTSQWKVSVSPRVSTDVYVVDAADHKQMTAETSAQKPVLPSHFSQGVNAVQASRFASYITLERYRDAMVAKNDTGFGTDGGADTGSATPDDLDSGDQDTVPQEISFQAPVVHLGEAEKYILVEAPFSEGRVVVLSDPYIVSNNGINLVDNAQLAINLATASSGVIAFDEYHHGYGANNNRFFQYFEGTPVIAIFLQCGLVVALIFFSQSRRFARSIPDVEPDRLSKLEYVSAMAELQQRTRAYDLAIENIYTDFRRRVSALVGLDNTTATRREVAQRVAERIGADAPQIEDLMFRCEDAIHGEPIGKKDTMSIIERLRDLEERLGLKRVARKGL